MPRVFPPPAPDGVLDARHFLGEDDTYWMTFSQLVRAALVTGPRIPDARIAALCLDHGVRELWTADRDFSRFPRLRTRNPLVAA